MTDIVDRLRNAAPSDIDKFQADIERRTGLGDDFINKFLSDTFLSINVDALPPAQIWAWKQIKKSFQSQ